MTRNPIARHPRPFGLLILGAALLAVAGCSDGDDGDQGPPGPGPGTTTALAQGDDLPGIAIEVLSLSGGSGSGGRFQPGDTLRVNYRLQKTDGSDWDIAELSSGRALVSGPTFNYQRVLAEVTDLVTASVAQSDGSYTYTFASELPDTYLAPFNDSTAFGPEDGELTGEALLEGTYTLGLTFGWDFTVDGESARDAENATVDFVIGNSGAVEPREVVKLENCNRCHEELRIHGGRREDASMCVLCHTAGAEDVDDPDLAGGTPGVSIDFKVMIHKIHSGEHLPSVQGVTTDTDGSRLYGAGTPYVVAGRSLSDYSHVAFPAWPHALVATPRDEGYTLLAAMDRLKEDAIRTGPSNCAVCHGDPDDDGPLTAPAQGDIHMTQPTRQACGSCHDDVHWGQDYTANGETMPEQANNSNCTLCHAPTGDSLAVFDSHLHPLKDPSFDPGLNFELSDIVEAGMNDADGTIDVGEKISFAFRITDDSGAEVAPASIAAPSLVISGPTSNYNVLLNTSIPLAALTGAQPFIVMAPRPILLERLGLSDGMALETFTTDFSPHWNLSGATTSVLVRTATAGGDSTLASASVAPQNYIDVLDATGFARDDVIAVGDGTAEEEYVRIQLVDGTRLWFSSLAGGSYKPGLELAHDTGAPVREVTLSTMVAGTDYTLSAATGEVQELVEFGDVVVLASYTTDFVLPATYPLALNDGPDLDESNGEWAGKSLVDGTYSLGLWSARTLTLNLHDETNSYRSTSDARLVDFLVGDAEEQEPYALISSGSNCFNCHQELGFHGFGRRGFESCVLCHSASGGDRPPYVAGNAEETPGVDIGFRTMLHKIHMGEELANASSYIVNGFGASPYPNNFTAHDYAEVVFPALPGGTQNCAKCHGETNEAWHEPAPRGHPTEQGAPVQRWAAVCGACHDTTDALAHIAVQTDAGGNESCAVCHGSSAEWSVERMHRPY